MSLGRCLQYTYILLFLVEDHLTLPQARFTLFKNILSPSNTDNRAYLILFNMTVITDQNASSPVR